MEPEIEVFDDVMHVSRNRSFSLRMRFTDPKKAASLATFFIFSSSSPIFLDAEVVAEANQPSTLILIDLYASFFPYHAPLNVNNREQQGLNANHRMEYGKMIGLLILLIFKALHYVHHSVLKVSFSWKPSGNTLSALVMMLYLIKKAFQNKTW